MLNEIVLTGYGSGINAPGLFHTVRQLDKVVYFGSILLHLGKYGPGTYTYTAGHNLILAHARAYRLYESYFKPTQKGRRTEERMIFLVFFLHYCHTFKCFIRYCRNHFEHQLVSTKGRSNRERRCSRKSNAVPRWLVRQSNLRNRRVSLDYETQSICFTNSSTFE